MFNKLNNIRECSLKVAIHGLGKHHCRCLKTLRCLARCRFLRYISIRHDHYHRLCLALSNEVIEYLSGSSQLWPGVFVTANAMQQIENRVPFRAACLISCRRIDRHPTCQTSRWTVVPYLCYRSMGYVFHLIKPLYAPSNHKDIEHTGDVAHCINVQWISDFHTIHDQTVGIKLGRKGWRGVWPHPLLVLFQLLHTRSFLLSIGCFHLFHRQKVACYLHFLCFWSYDIEGNCVVSIDNWRRQRCLVPW